MKSLSSSALSLEFSLVVNILLSRSVKIYLFIFENQQFITHSMMVDCDNYFITILNKTKQKRKEKKIKKKLKEK